MTKYTTRSSMFALMLVLFIDGMGQGIIFPILTNTILSPDNTFFLVNATQTDKNLWYGILIAIYYFMWFISAPILGHWSDNVGRKKALIVCLVLAAIGFLISALAFTLNSLLLLIFGRFIGGVTSGDQAIAKAAIIDQCPFNKKSIYLGLMLFAVTLGLIIGPFIGALLQNSHLVAWFTIKTPFYFALLLSIFNILLLSVSFVEKNRNNIHSKHHIQKPSSMKLFIDVIMEPKIRFLLLSYFLTQLGWQMFYMHTPSFAAKTLNMTTMQISYLLILMGVGIGLGLGIFPTLFQKINHKIVAIIGYSGLLISNILFGTLHSSLVLWLSLLPSASLFGLAVANILPLFSNRVDNNRQGWIMGITGSIVALTGGIGSLIASMLTNFNNHFPYVCASLIILLGIVCLFFDNDILS